MAKKDLKDLLGKKSPTELRKNIQQVDILKEASEALSSSKEETAKADEKEREEEQNTTIEEKKQTIKSRGKTERANRSTSRRKPKVFSSKDVQAVLEIDKRATERYSFEIYSDQKEDIQQVCDLYEKATGNKLSASRLIREVLDTFLPDALKTFELSGEEKPEK